VKGRAGRLYNRHIDRYATLISRDGDRLTVRYEGDTQIYIAPSWLFEDIEEVKRPLAPSVVRPSRSRRASQI
jgi:hypothetical protein